MKKKKSILQTIELTQFPCPRNTHCTPTPLPHPSPLSLTKVVIGAVGCCGH